MDYASPYRLDRRDHDSKLVAHHEYVEFFAEPDGRFSLVKVTGRDGSSMSYAFRSEQRNTPLAAELFQFKAPEGYDLVTLRNEP